MRWTKGNGLVRRSEAEALLDGRVGKYILYVSRVEPRKNHLLLLRAYVEGRFYERGYALVFIGKTSIPVPELHRYCEKLPEDIRQNVFFSNRSRSKSCLHGTSAPAFRLSVYCRRFRNPAVGGGRSGCPLYLFEPHGDAGFPLFRRGNV